MAPRKTYESDFDYNDPFSVSDSPEAAKEAALAELSTNEEEKRGHLVNAAAAHKEHVKEASRDRNWGHSIDSNDPFEGYVDDPSAALEIINAELDKTEKKKTGEAAPELTENEERLAKVFEEGQRIHNRVKDPGSYKYRLLSVAAVEMKKIEQPEDKKERTKAINTELEKAIKDATGGEEPGKYEGDVLAAAQAYLSEILIGDSADFVSIGTTKTIVNPTGQVGKNPKIYKDLVVVRWIEDKTNHVLAFSPRRDTAVYTLVDDSMGDSWRDRFLTAGAIAGKERDKISALNHERHSEFAHHERTFEKVVDRMLEDELSELRTNDTLEPKEKAKRESSISRRLDQLAYYHETLSTKTGANTSTDGQSHRTNVDNINEDDGNDKK